MSSSLLPNDRKISISASLLAADFGYLADGARRMENAGADSFHMDIIDGHFAENFAFGPEAVMAVRRCCTLPIEVHLEIENPEKFINIFAEAGADLIFIHLETCQDIPKVLNQIALAGKKAGIALTSQIPVDSIRPWLPFIHSVLLLAVPPGFGGASPDKSIVARATEADRFLAEAGRNIDLQVDGGITPTTAPKLALAGVNVFVSGTYLFGGDYSQRVQLLRGAISQAVPSKE